MCECKRSKNIYQRLIDIDELIELLGEKSRQAVYNKLNRGVFPIPTYKHGKSLRWKLIEVQDYIKRLQPIK
jgi:predicted DNA-binding transcriptional regulator AlpA